MKSKKKIFLTGYIIVVGIVVLWMGLHKEMTREVLSDNRVAYEQKVDSVAFGYQLAQTFRPQYEGLQQISIYVDTNSCVRENGVLRFSILDDTKEVVMVKDIMLSELPSYGWYTVVIEQPLIPDEEYQLILESIDCVDLGPKISFYDAKLAAAQEEKGETLTYAGVEVSNAALRIRFTYEVPVAEYVYAIYFIFGLLMGAIILNILESKGGTYAENEKFLSHSQL